MLDLAANYADWIVGVSGALVLVVAFARKGFKKVRLMFAKINAALETLLGRDEIRHPETGEVVVEATPNLGMRFARMEEAIVKMADTHVAVQVLTRRVDSLTNSFEQHVTDCGPTPAPVTVINHATTPTD